MRYLGPNQKGGELYHVNISVLYHILMIISQLGRKRSIQRTSCAPVTSTVVATVVR